MTRGSAGGPVQVDPDPLARPVQALPREPIGKWGMRIWAHKSTALACAHFMLAMRAHGFDTCPMEGLDSARVKRILGLPKEAL